MDRIGTGDGRVSTKNLASFKLEEPDAYIIVVEPPRSESFVNAVDWYDLWLHEASHMSTFQLLLRWIDSLAVISKLGVEHADLASPYLQIIENKAVFDAAFYVFIQEAVALQTHFSIQESLFPNSLTEEINRGAHQLEALVESYREGAYAEFVEDGTFFTASKAYYLAILATIQKAEKMNLEGRTDGGPHTPLEGDRGT